MCPLFKWVYKVPWCYFPQILLLWVLNVVDISGFFSLFIYLFIFSASAAELNFEPRQLLNATRPKTTAPFGLYTHISLRWVSARTHDRHPCDAHVWHAAPWGSWACVARRRYVKQKWVLGRWAVEFWATLQPEDSFCLFCFSSDLTEAFPEAR